MASELKLRYLPRLSKIVTVLFNEGLHYFIYEIKLHHLVSFKHRFKYWCGWCAHRPLQESLVHSLQNLGGLFVKAGQILSTRSDILPPKFIKVLSKLQDKDPPFPFKQAKFIIESQLKKPLNKIFKSFREKPYFAASLGQVHKAVLLNGTCVAVKVQRPGIEKRVRIDFKLLHWLLRHFRKNKPELKKYKFDEAFHELKKWTLRELDYRIEMRNLLKFNENFLSANNVIFPKVYPKFSSKQVLVMEWLNGKKISSFYGTKKGKELARIGAKSMIRQYFEFAFFHGDPHPGNILVSKTGKIIFLDAGMVGSFTPKLQEVSLQMFLNLIEGDAHKTTKILIGLNKSKTKIDEQKLLKLNIKLISNWHGTKIKEYSFSRLFYTMLKNATDNGLRLPSNLILLAKSIFTLDEVAVQLDPKFDIVKEAKPILQEILLKKYGLKTMAKMKLHELELRVEKKIVKIPRFAEGIIEKLLK